MTAPRPTYREVVIHAIKVTATNWTHALPRGVISHLLCFLPFDDRVHRVPVVCRLFAEACRVVQLTSEDIDMRCRVDPRTKALTFPVGRVGDEALLAFAHKRWQHLRRLALRSCTSITDRGFMAVCSLCPHLTHLDLSVLPFVGFPSLIGLHRLPCLQTLILRDLPLVTVSVLRNIAEMVLLAIDTLILCVAQDGHRTSFTADLCALLVALPRLRVCSLRVRTSALIPEAAHACFNAVVAARPDVSLDMEFANINVVRSHVHVA